MLQPQRWTPVQCSPSLQVLKSPLTKVATFGEGQEWRLAVQVAGTVKHSELSGERSECQSGWSLQTPLPYASEGWTKGCH